MADSLENVTSHHAVSCSLVSGSLLRKRGQRANDVAHAVCDENAGRCDDSLGITSDVAGDHDQPNGEPDGLAAVVISVKSLELIESRQTHLTSQNPISRGQIILCVKGRKAMRAVPNTHTRLPMVIISNRVLAHRVATRPAITREMTCNDRPAQSRRAALMVEKPRPLMMEPEKLVRTPLGTDEPNMAIVKSQLQCQTIHRQDKSMTHFFGSLSASKP